jgi:hypothetical protein
VLGGKKVEVARLELLEPAVADVLLQLVQEINQRRGLRAVVGCAGVCSSARASTTI